MKAVQRSARNDDRATFMVLTTREIDVLNLAGQGLSIKRIARSLEIEPGTATWHLKNAYHKLGVGCREEALQKARMENLIAVTASCDREIMLKAVQRSDKNDDRVTFMVLTPREIDVLNLAGQGLSIKRIARLLDIEPGTATWHLKNAYHKLGVGCREEALEKARMENLIGASVVCSTGSRTFSLRN